MIELAKYVYSILDKAFETNKNIGGTRKKQVEALEVLKCNTQKLTIKDVIAENTLTEEARYGLNKVKEIEKTVDREKLLF